MNIWKRLQAWIKSRIPYAYLKCPDCGFTAKNLASIWGKAEITQAGTKYNTCPECGNTEFKIYNCFFQCESCHTHISEEQMALGNCKCGHRNYRASYETNFPLWIKIKCLFGLNLAEQISGE